MTPNLRLNKKLTKMLNSTKLEPEDDMSMIGVEWNMNYGKRILGCYYNCLFYNCLFFLQRNDEGQYRLIGSSGKDCKFYIIDDIDAFVEHIGICMLDLIFEYEEERKAELLHSLQETKEMPCQGVIVIEEGRAYVYEHYNY